MTVATATLRTALRPLLARQGEVVMRQISAGRRVDLSDWDRPLAEAAAPYLTRPWLRGAAQAVAGVRRMVRKAFGSRFANYSPESIRAVDSLALRFAESTNRTSEHSAEVARELTRRELAEGLQRNEALDRLTARINKIFRSPKRAARIAKTETMRALNAGQFETMKRLDFVRAKHWVATTEACDICKALEKRGDVPIDEPFDIDPKSGPYAVVMYPPRHPWCSCTLGYSF